MWSWSPMIEQWLRQEDYNKWLAVPPFLVPLRMVAYPTYATMSPDFPQACASASTLVTPACALVDSLRLNVGELLSTLVFVAPSSFSEAIAEV